MTRLWVFFLNGVAQVFVQKSNGDVWVATIGVWTWVQIASGTTVGGLHMELWKGVDAQGNPEAVLWTDTSVGYGSWDGTTWSTLVSGLKGQAIAIYQGRVWIAAGTQITFTAPGSYNDFLVADFGGSFTITDATITGPVRALKATQNWLYLIGDGMMALNNVQVESVGGSSTLVTTYYLTPVSSSIGITNDKAALVFDNVLFVVTDIGLWGFYGLNGQQLSVDVGDSFTGSQTLFAAQVYGKNLVCTSAGFVFMLNDQRWFTTLDDSFFWTDVTTFNMNGVQAYAISTSDDLGDGIYQLFSDHQTARSCSWSSRLFDAGNASINKRVVKCAVEIFPDELNSPASTITQGTLQQQIVGYIAGGQPITNTNFDVTLNQWLPHSTNLVDRYFGMECTLTAPPGTAVAGMYFQFQDSTSWPIRSQ